MQKVVRQTWRVWLPTTASYRKLSSSHVLQDATAETEGEAMAFNACIVGAGPSGLAAAIRLKQLSIEKGHDVSVCVLEKGAEVGALIQPELEACRHSFSPARILLRHPALGFYLNPFLLAIPLRFFILPGAHILSGNVFEPRALDELLPDWRDDADCPIAATPVTSDRFYFFTQRMALRLPTPPQMRNKGNNYVISLRYFMPFLALLSLIAGGVPT
jgi:electron-transferring-flavoprotein dehydrogenase